ncbi:MAG: hypothetical protein EP346_07045 [Bacteroidetes bacterium]|nr:MAG: hypothetical protein EP346_07045 [Bacteroidota bacterium]
MKRGFKLIRDRLGRRKHAIKLVGIKSLECNFNPTARTYNPHFHLIVQTKEMAEVLIAEWLKQLTSKFAQTYAQDMRPVRNVTINMIEIIKYGSKIFTEPDLKKKSRGQIGQKKLYARALYNILAAMRGKRVFDRFGFNLPAESKAEIIKKTVDEVDWVYIHTVKDWVNLETGECLTNYSPDPGLVELLEKHINSTNC